MKWEYKTYESAYSLGSERIEEELNEFGEDSWELVTIFQEERPKDVYLANVVYVFKRPSN